MWYDVVPTLAHCYLVDSWCLILVQSVEQNMSIIRVHQSTSASVERLRTQKMIPGFYLILVGRHVNALSNLNVDIHVYFSVIQVDKWL